MKIAKYFIITTFVTLYIVTSTISTIHSIDFFKLSNPDWLAISLGIAFEIGAAASLASLVTLDKMNKKIVWCLFIVLTLMQVMSNLFYAYTHLHDYQSWIELFGLSDSTLIEQKRYVSIISGAILPLVALGFIKSLVDYMKPSEVVLEKLEIEDIKEINPEPEIIKESYPEQDVILSQPAPIIITETYPEAEVVIPEPENELTVLDKIKVFKNNGN